MRFLRRRPEVAADTEPEAADADGALLERDDAEPVDPASTELDLDARERAEPAAPAPEGPTADVAAAATAPVPLDSSPAEWSAASMAAAPSRPREQTRTGDLDEGLSRSRSGFMSRLRGILATPEGPSWDDVEETLIAGDVGPSLAMDVVEAAQSRRDPIGAEHAVREELERRLVRRDPEWRIDARRTADGPAVVLVVGVNGTGKTTTIGKLAALEGSDGKRVILAAADTFRAAAIEQLAAWGERAGADVVAHRPDADPGAVVYDALDAGVARGADLVLVDTAGRLHTKSNLMDELAKIRRIVNKRLPGAEPETLFVLDATTGQNGLSQAAAFHDSVGLTGIVLTKLDSTAKGGIVFAIEDRLGIPVRYVGVGEQVGDLLPFDPQAFVAALFA